MNPWGTVGSQTKKSVFDIKTHVAANIEAIMVLHVTAFWILIESEYLSSSRYHKIPEIGQYH